MRAARPHVAIAALLALGTATGCAAEVATKPRAAARLAPAARLIAEARREGIDLVDPLEIGPEIAVEAERFVPVRGKVDFRLSALLGFLGDRGYLNFQHVAGRSLTAREAYRERRGDCLSYAHLFTALSRKLGFDTYFVHVTDVRSYYERGGWFFVSSHVAVGHGVGPNTVVVDLAKEITDWKLAFYERIDDASALALYYNNVAVDAMTAGRTAEAERILRFFHRRTPGVVEIDNNLAVLLNRTRRPTEALTVLAGAIRRFPAYEPLYTNAVHAARALGMPDLAADYERRGAEISRGDPYFLFARALSLYERDKFALAARTFARAAEAKPDSVVILAWLTRAHLSAGQRRAGAEAFARAQRMAPGDPLVRELLEKYPELRSTAE